MIGIMAAHALGEGCAVGVSFCGERGWAQVCLLLLEVVASALALVPASGLVIVGIVRWARSAHDHLWLDQHVPTHPPTPRPGPAPQGLLTTLAIGVHNIPEGLAKATVLVGQGVAPRRALAWSVATCLPQPLVAVPSFVFVDAFTVSWRGGPRKGRFGVECLGLA
jgi:zinc transporter ZupT